MPDVTLKVGGVIYGGWTAINIKRSLSQVAGTFSLELTDKYPGAQASYKFRRDSACRVLLGGQTVITGYLESAGPDYDADSHALTVSGRDKTCDIADCCRIVEPYQFNKQTLLQIARTLCGKHGVEVAAEADTGAAFDTARIGAAETLLSFLVKLSRQRGVMPISYGDGRLVFTAPAGKGRAGTLELGKNIKSGRGGFNNADRFSHYVVKGHGPGGGAPAASLSEKDKELWLKTYRQPVAGKAEARDAGVSRYRPLVLVADTGGNSASFQARANWEAARRKGEANRITYKVDSWGPDNGGLWQINTLVNVRDPFEGIDGETYLVESVTYTLDETGGSQTELALVHPDAYKPEPPKPGKESFA